MAMSLWVHFLDHRVGLGARRRRNQYDAAAALACARRRNDVTRRIGIGTLHGPIMCKCDVVHKTRSR